MKAETELWRTYRRTKDTALRDQLVELHLVLVKYVAARVAGRLPRHLQIDDLYSAGLLGFLAAIEDYDPELGVKFSAYATPRIRGAIFDELRRLDLVPRSVRRRIREAERAIDALARRGNREPTDEEIAKEIGTTIEAYRQLLTEGITVISLDAPLNAQDEWASDGINLEDTGAPSPLQSLAAKERRALLASVIDSLPEKERQVLALYYYEELTMREVGDTLGVTESRVSQIHSSAVLRMRASLRRRRLRESDLVFTTGSPRARQA